MLLREVIIATDEKTSKRVALKKVIIHKDTDGVPITALREIMILKSLDHENVIRLKEVALSQGKNILQQQLCECILTRTSSRIG